MLLCSLFARLQHIRICDSSLMHLVEILWHSLLCAFGLRQASVSSSRSFRVWCWSEVATTNSLWFWPVVCFEQVSQIVLAVLSSPVNLSIVNGTFAFPDDRILRHHFSVGLQGRPIVEVRRMLRLLVLASVSKRSIVRLQWWPDLKDRLRCGSV